MRAEEFDRIIFSEARESAGFDDWPSGQSRVKCEFWVEKDEKHGERVCRRTTNTRTGLWCKPKKLTYAARQRIVTGSDGRTYVLSYGKLGGVTIFDHALKYSLAYVTDDERQRYTDLMALLFPNTGHPSVVAIRCELEGCQAAAEREEG